MKIHMQKCPVTLIFLVTALFTLSCKKKQKDIDLKVSVINKQSNSAVPGAMVQLYLYKFGTFGIWGSSSLIDSAITNTEGLATFNLQPPPDGHSYELRARQSERFSASPFLDYRREKEITLLVFPLVRKKIAAEVSGRVKTYSIFLSVEKTLEQPGFTEQQGNKEFSFLFGIQQSNIIQIFRRMDDGRSSDTLIVHTPADADTSTLHLKF